MVPLATCAFCARMAAVISAVEMLKLSIFAGSIQIRMARSVPKSCACPMPFSRSNSGTTLRDA